MKEKQVKPVEVLMDGHIAGGHPARKKYRGGVAGIGWSRSPCRELLPYLCALRDSVVKNLKIAVVANYGFSISLVKWRLLFDIERVKAGRLAGLRSQHGEGR